MVERTGDRSQAHDMEPELNSNDPSCADTSSATLRTPAESSSSNVIGHHDRSRRDLRLNGTLENDPIGRKENSLAEDTQEPHRARLPSRYHEFEDLEPPAHSLSATARSPSDDVKGSRPSCYSLRSRSDILPPKEQPFFVQMQAFCQRWAIWAATIDDRARRAEVLQCVTNKMLEAWKFGVVSGHYKMGTVEAAEKERLLQQAKWQRRNRENPRAVAPFATEAGASKYYHILNSELDRTGITFAMISGRIEKGDLSSGEHLLSLMCERLGRPIAIEDWKPTSRVPFKPYIHKRNIFMYALWEVQSCRKHIADLEQKLAGKPTNHQYRSWSGRVDTIRTRVLQHLALAIELNLQKPVDSVDVSEAEDISEDESVISLTADNSEAPTASPSSQTDIEAHENGNETETVEGRNPIDRRATNQDEDSAFSIQELDDSNHPSGFLETGQAFANELTAPSDHIHDLPDLPPMSAEMEALLMGNDRKRLFEETCDDDAEQVCASMRDLHGTADSPPEQSKKQKVLQDSSDTVFTESPMLSTLRGYSFPTAKDFEPPLEQHLQGPSLRHNLRSHVDQEFATIPTTCKRPDPELAILKHRYLAEVWTPKINDLLHSHGHRPVMGFITSWSDIRSILTNLDVDLVQRNQYLGDYKNGFACWAAADQEEMSARKAVELKCQQPRQVPKLVLKMPKVGSQGPQTGEFSDAMINETRGFAFRCLSQASPVQRAQLDDIVDEYVKSQITTRTKRFGKYVMIHDPNHPSRMPIGHGFWNQKDGSRPEGTDWFYAGYSPSRDFHQPATHIHDMASVTPETPRKVSRRTRTKSDWPTWHAQQQSQQRQHHSQKVQKHSRTPKALVTGNRSRSKSCRVNFKGPEQSGSEYDPDDS